MRELVRFDDPDAYLATFVSSDTRLTLPGRAPFASRVVRAGSDDAWFRTNLSKAANTLRLGASPRAIFAMTLHGPPVRVDGAEVPSGCLTWQPPGELATVFDPGGAEIGSFSYPFAAFEAAGRSLHGDPPARPSGISAVYRPDPGLWQGLVRALLLALRLPGGPPSALAAEVLRAVLACIAGPDIRPEPARSRADRGRRRSVVDGLVALADAAVGKPVPLAVVCERLGVPLRTLNTACNAVLGMGATRYLRGRRMGAVREVLRQGGAESVTDAATRHGFYEFGRFAGEYRAAYRELPSETLRRARRRRA